MGFPSGVLKVSLGVFLKVSPGCTHEFLGAFLMFPERALRVGR